MADKKISELDAITGANTAATDVFVVVDTSTGQTKKITREELNNAIEQDVLSSIDIDTINGDFTVNGNINLGDNDKAIFGAGSDLQIYHNESNSVIRDGGVGNLYVQGTNLFLTDSAGYNFVGMVDNGTGGTVTLYHDNSAKLATTSTGIDVTGTVTADGLTIAGSSSNIRYDVASSNPHTHPTLQLQNQNATDGNVAALMLSAYNANDVGGSAYIYAQSETANQKGNLLFAREDGANNPTTSMKLSSNGDISFYEDTGTTAKLFWDASAEALGIGTSSPAGELEVNSAGDSDVYIRSGDTNAASIYFGSQSDSQEAAIRYYNSNNSLRFFGHDMAEAMRLDSSGRLGIGTSSPVRTLDVRSGTTDVVANFESSDTGAFIALQDNTTSTDTAVMIGATGDNLRFDAGDLERMRITSAGLVGIGTTSPDATLQVVASSTNSEYARFSSTDARHLRLSSFDTASADAGHDINASSSNGAVSISTGSTERMRIDSSGNLLHGTTTAASSSNVTTVHSSSTGGTYTQYHSGSGGSTVGTGVNDFRVYTYTGAVGSESYSERMRIDSSGNVLVGGTTAFGNGTTTINSSGLVYASRASNKAGHFNRESSDGEIVVFSKDGTTVGTIGSYGAGGMYIGSGDVELAFRGDLDSIYPVNNLAGRDNAIDLGLSGARFDDIYATNGTIQTSDQNEKQDIEALSEAEQRVAVAAKGLLRKFRWIDSVEEKGDDARIHFGIIAQDLQAAFEAEGLDAGRYAMFINSTWTDEETGEERSRMGVRYNQLLAFIIAAI